MAGKYIYLLADLKTGDIMEELPLGTVSFGQTLNGPTSFTTTNAMTTGHITPGQLVHGFSWDKFQKANIKPGARLIHVLRDSVPLYSGILYSVSADPTTRSMQMSGSDHLSYLARRRLDTDQTFTTADQFQIVRDLVDEMQKNTYGDLGIQVTAGNSGVTRDREFKAIERWRFSDAITELAELDDGFDYTMRVSGNVVDGIVPTLTLASRLGSNSGNWVLQLGKNCESLAYSEDAAGMANTYTVLGNGNSEERPKFTAQNPGSLNTYPQFDEVRNIEATDSEQTLINKTAYAYLAAYQTPVRTAVVRINPDDPDIKYGSINIGDDVRLIASYGFTEFDEKFRIMNIAVTIDEQGKETVVLTLTQFDSTVL